MNPVDSCCSLRGVSGIEILQSVCHRHSLNVSDGLDFSVSGWSFEEGQAATTSSSKVSPLFLFKISSGQERHHESSELPAGETKSEYTGRRSARASCLVNVGLLVN